MIVAPLPTSVGSRPCPGSFVLDFLVLVWWFFLSKNTLKKNFSFQKPELSQLQICYLATA